MYSAVDPRVRDVIGDLLERSVLQDNGRGPRIRYGHQVPALTIETAQNLGSSVTTAAVIRGVARKTRGENEWEKVGIAFRLRVSVCIAGTDCRLRTPEDVVVLVEERRHKAVTDRHV